MPRRIPALCASKRQVTLTDPAGRGYTVRGVGLRARRGACTRSSVRQRGRWRQRRARDCSGRSSSPVGEVRVRVQYTWPRLTGPSRYRASTTPPWMRDAPQTKISRSVLLNLIRPGADRFRTRSCCRRKRISASRPARDLHSDMRSVPTCLSTYHYYEHILLRTFANVKQLTGDVANSPIVQSKTQGLIGIGAAYHF